jgi:DNA-binding transcriptional MerR regulator
MNFTFYASPSLTIVCVPAGASALYSLAAAARLTGVHVEMLRYYCRLGLIDALQDDRESEPVFDENALSEVRRIEHYRRHLGVNRRALPLLCELWREGERQKIELRFLRAP